MDATLPEVLDCFSHLQEYFPLKLTRGCSAIYHQTSKATQRSHVRLLPPVVPQFFGFLCPQLKVLPASELISTFQNSYIFGRLLTERVGFQKLSDSLSVIKQLAQQLNVQREVLRQ